MEQKDIKQKLMLTDRRELTIDAVCNVESLGEDFVEISSDTGKIIIEGAGLKIAELNQEKRTVHISGKIDSILYKNERKSKPFLSRFMK